MVQLGRKWSRSLHHGNNKGFCPTLFSVHVYNSAHVKHMAAPHCLQHAHYPSTKCSLPKGPLHLSFDGQFCSPERNTILLAPYPKVIPNNLTCITCLEVPQPVTPITLQLGCYLHLTIITYRVLREKTHPKIIPEASNRPGRYIAVFCHAAGPAKQQQKQDPSPQPFLTWQRDCMHQLATPSAA